MTDRILTRPGAQLAYSIEGTGPVVVGAHGLTMSRAGDERSGQGFGGLAERGRTVVRYDARGHGASTGRPIPADYSWPSLALDLLALVDEVSPDAPVDAIGASMGCATVLYAAVAAPERFRRLVLAIPPTAWETRPPIASGYEAQAAFVEERGLEAYLAMTATYPNPPAVPADFRFVPEVEEWLLPTVFRGAAVSDLPERARISTLGMPTLILAWAGDPGHPLSTSEELLALLPEAELQVAQSPEDVEGWVAVADEFLSR